MQRTAALLFLLLASASAARADILDPRSFASLGAFPTQTGAYRVDTTIGRVPTLYLPDGTRLSGVVSGTTAVFDFDSIAISSGDSFRVTGGPREEIFGGFIASYGFALLSRGDLTMAAGSLITGFGSGQDGPPGGGLGGPPVPQHSGGGPGGGRSGTGGGGGGNGGRGGDGGGFPTFAGGPGGPAGGGVGSGGGGGVGGIRGTGGIGGAGGGSIELGAVGAVVIGGTIDVHATAGNSGNGGGGGGSGGTITLNGATASLVGTLIANGGNGGDSGFNHNGGGGGGGGGLILVQTDTGSFVNGGTIYVAGGLGGLGGSVNGVPTSPGSPGSDGIIVVMANQNTVPEPTSLALTAVGGLALAFARRRAV